MHIMCFIHHSSTSVTYPPRIQQWKRQQHTSLFLCESGFDLICCISFTHYYCATPLLALWLLYIPNSDSSFGRSIILISFVLPPGAWGTAGASSFPAGWHPPPQSSRSSVSPSWTAMSSPPRSSRLRPSSVSPTRPRPATHESPTYVSNHYSLPLLCTFILC